MKRRLFESVVQVYGCGWTAICQENRAWHLPNRATEWVELPELPPIDDSDATIAEIHHRLNKGLLTHEEFAKKYDRFYGTDMAKLSENQAIPVTGAVGQVIGYGVTPGQGDGIGEFLDPSLGQPWPEDQASNRSAATSESIAYQVLGRQDLPICDRANLAAMVNQAERLLIRNIDDSSIDLGCVLRSLIGEIRNELKLANPGKVA